MGDMLLSIAVCLAQGQNLEGLLCVFPKEDNIE